MQAPAAVEDLIGCKWSAADVLPINGSEEDVEALREALLLSRAAAKAARLSRKVKPGKAAVAPAVAPGASLATDAVAGISDGAIRLPQVDAKLQKRALEVGLLDAAQCTDVI